MSVFVSGCVWRHARAKGSNLLVLLAIADIAGDDGIARPEWDTSIANLARKTRLSERAVQYCIRDLEKDGELSTYAPHGRARANTYQVLIDANHKLFDGPVSTPRLPVDKPVDKNTAENPGVQPVAPQGCKPASKKVQPVAPDPSFRHTSLPSSTRAKPPPTRPQWITDYLNAGIKPELRAWAKARAWDGLLEQHWEQFADYLSQERNWKRYTDLDAAFRTCVRSDWGEVREHAEKERRFGRQNVSTDLNSWWRSTDGVKAKGFAIGMPYDPQAARAELVKALQERPPQRQPEPEEMPAWAWRRYEIAVLDAVVDREGWGAWVDRANRQHEYDAVCRRRKFRGAEVPAEWEAEHAR
jgi:hypothetical protein